MFICFDRSCLKDKGDIFEIISNYALAPMRYSFGKTVKVSADLKTFEEKRRSKIQCIAMGILSLLLFPVTALMTLIGRAIWIRSKTHRALYASYKRKEIDHAIETIKGSDLNPEEMQFVSSGNTLLGDLKKEHCLSSVNTFVKDARKLQNRRLIDQLKKELKDTFGEKILMNDWLDLREILGAEVIDGYVLLSERRIEKIKKTVHKTFCAITDVKAALEKLKAELRQGLPPQEKLIKNRHPAFSHLPAIPGKTGESLKKEYNKLINQALVEAEMRLKRSLKGSIPERFVLKHLGYNIQGDYDNIDIAQEAISQLTKRLLVPNKVTEPVPEFRQHLQILTTYERFKLAKVPKFHYGNISQLINKTRELHRALNQKIVESYKGLRFVEPELIEKIKTKMPQAFKTLCHLKKQSLNRIRNQFKIDFVKNCSSFLTKPHFTDHLDREYQKALEFQKGIINERMLEEKLTPFLNFYKQFVGREVELVEYEQGQEGTSAALGSGVCLSLCYELNKSLIDEPTKPLANLNLDQISLRARFVQANHACSKHIDRAESEIPESLLRRDNLSCEVFLPIKTSITDFIEWLFKKITTSEKASPGLIIKMVGKKWGHTLYIHFDKENKRYLFRDPNFLTAEHKFRKFSDGIDWLKETLYRVIFASYPNTLALQAIKINKRK